MDWSGCTLQEFLDCLYSLATNDQVCMLAGLSLVGCHNLPFIPKGKWAQLLLKSAKKNLWGMAFFALMEFQQTFNLKFIWPFMQYNSLAGGGMEVDEDTAQCMRSSATSTCSSDYAKDLFQQLEHREPGAPETWRKACCTEPKRLCCETMSKGWALHPLRTA